MRPRASIVLILGLTACGGDDTGAPDAGADAAAGAVAGELVVLTGGGYGRQAFPPVVLGAFPDREGALWYTEAVRAGACRVERYQPGSCAGPCAGVCVEPGECRPFPTYRSAGVIAIDGLAAPLTLEPSFDGHYATAGGLPDPLFAAGGSVRARAAGALIPAFDVSAVAPRAVTIAAFDGAGVAVLSDGAALTLTWPNADPASRVRVFVHSGGALHGTPPAAALTCDDVDRGELTIARAVIEAMPAMGRGCAKMHDCASFGIMRYRRAAVATAAGEVQLVVASGRDYEVVHATP